MATIQIDQHPTPITAAAGEAITITHVDGGTLYYGLTFDVDDDDNAGSLTLGQSFRVGPGTTRYMISFGGAVYVSIERGDVATGVFDGGFSYTPDAVYVVGVDGPTFGAGFSANSATVEIHRWGSALAIEGSVRFDAANLNNYEFYNDPLIILPGAWFGGHPPFLVTLPPLMSASAFIQHNAWDASGARQSDSRAVLALGTPFSTVTPGATGVHLNNDGLNPALFQAGDYLDLRLSTGGFLLAPAGADFT